MNHFLAKFKHRIESDRVSDTPSKFGEDFETYLEGLPAGTNPDKKVQT